MTPDATILSFDTATSNCSVALTRGGFIDGIVVACVNFSSGISHSRKLLGLIDRLLADASVKLSEVSAIAVGLGPGSFTGLRIGMATAKGLCHGTAKPLLGISSLDAIGASVRSDKLICVVLDARKKEVYSCFYRHTENSFAGRCSEPIVLPPAVLAEQINEPVVMAGDGVDVYSTVWSEVLGNRLEKAPARNRYPAADTIGFLADEHYRAGQFLELSSCTPVYVRSSDAELSLIRPVTQQKARR